MSREEIAAVIESLSDLPAMIRDADPADKADIYSGIGLRLTYQTEPQSILAQVSVGEGPYWRIESVRGGT